MPLQEKIREIRNKYDEARKGIVTALSERGIAETQEIKAAESESIRLALHEHFKCFPHHRDIALGNGPTLEERAEVFVEEVFTREEDTKLSYDFRIWNTAPYDEKVLASPLTTEIIHVVGLIAYPKIKKARSWGNCMYLLGAGFGTISGVVLSAALILPYSLPAGFATSLGIWSLGVAGSIHSIIKTPIPISSRKLAEDYIHSAKVADKFLAEVGRQYLPLQNPYRAAGDRR